MTAPTADTSHDGEEGDVIAGDRGPSTLSAARSLQSRISNLLAIGLISVLGVGLLGWYYARTLSRPATQKHAAQAASQSQADGDLPLPALGKVDPPTSPLSGVLGPKPDEPPTTPIGQAIPLTEVPVAQGAPAQPPVKSPEQLALERRLAGPVSTDRAKSDLSRDSERRR